MKGRVIALHDDGHAALIVDGRVEDLLLAADDTPRPGEIWEATLDRPIPGQNAAFVRIGAHQGYLRDMKGMKGQRRFPVQVAGLPEPGKAIPVERRLLVKGRALILTPGAPGVNISRQIRDPEVRTRLEAIAAPDEDTGIIIRSAARDLPDAVLHAELAHLTRQLGALDGLDGCHAAATPWAVALREWTGDPVEMIAVSDGTIRDMAAAASLPLFGCDPGLQDRLTPGDGDPFDHFGVWEEVDHLKGARADLPSGGWMAIEATRAMVTVDVNTGDQFGQGAGMTASVEAARELPRQLRLRGLGGQLIVDFAPIKKMHRRRIEETLKTAFRRDPIATTLAGWTPLGNFELQRKRERRPLAEHL